MVIYLANNYEPFSPVLVRGEGSILWDENDKAYIDMFAGFSATSLGHGHPRILKVLNEQASKLSITSRMYKNKVLEDFAGKLCTVTGLDVALPMNTGAEAVETAIKAARRWGHLEKGIFDGNQKIVVMNNNFHGRTTTIIGFSSEDSYRMGFGPFNGGFISVSFGNFEALHEILKIYKDNVCAVLLEPIQGEAGVIIPPDGYLNRVRNLCNFYNILMIADEVQSGLGRTGYWFACNHEHVKPDIMILGKTLGGGVLPVSAIVGKRKIMDVFTPGSHGSTFGGNPLAAAVGHETLDVLSDENLIELSNSNGAYMLNELKKINSPIIKEIRGRGLWVGIELIPDIPANLFVKRLIAHGVITVQAHGKTIRLSPALNISNELLNTALYKIREVCWEFE